MKQQTTSSTAIDESLPPEISPEFLEALRQAGVVEAELFGSLTDGSAGPDSDIDLLVRFEHPVSLFERMEIAEDLERIAGRRVDLLTKIHPYFEPYITPTLVPLPL